MNDLSEFSRRIDGLRLPISGERFEIAATEEERAALAQRFDLLALDRLDAKMTVKPMAGGFYRLTAEFAADVTQACIVTLEPVANHLAESFTLIYGPAEEEGEIVLDGDAEPVEPLDDGMIDLGEAVAQQLSLVLDPFPRAPGVSLDTEVSGGDDDEEPVPESPFAALARLRQAGRGPGKD